MYSGSPHDAVSICLVYSLSSPPNTNTRGGRYFSIVINNYGLEVAMKPYFK